MTKPYKVIRKIIEYHKDTLKTVLPGCIYECLLQSYFATNHMPRERKQRKDLRYLREVLKIES